MLIKSALQLVSPSGVDGGLSILIFHRVLPAPDPLFPGEVDCQMFDRVVGWLCQWFNVLPLEKAISHLRQGTLPARPVSITFDDGYADNLLYAAPILVKHQVSATFFIATAFIDGGRMWNDTIIESVRNSRASRLDAHFVGLDLLDLSSVDRKRQALSQLIPAIKHLPSPERADAVERVSASCAASLPNDLMLTSGQLKALRELGMDIGAHTVNHPILAKLDYLSARKEIAESRDFLEHVLGERITLFAYPNGRRDGDYTEDHVSIARDLGFTAAVTTNPGISRKNTNLFELPRFTPWDRTRARFGLRLLQNIIQSR